MTEATIKQINFANNLGIDSPEEFTKEALKDMIDRKLQEGNRNKPKPQAQNNTSNVQTSRHDIIVSRVEKPHSYEFGKAGDRHKIYYSSIEDLNIHLEALKQAGLYNGAEELKPEEFKNE